MGGRPTDLLGWAEEMDRVADLCRDEGLPRRIEEGNRDLAKMLRQAAAENAALRERVAVLDRVREAAALVAERKKAMMVAAEQRLSGVHGQSMAATAAYNLAEAVYRDARRALRDSENVMHEALAAADQQQETDR